jgi:hypothetical protein
MRVDQIKGLNLFQRLHNLRALESQAVTYLLKFDFCDTQSKNIQVLSASLCIFVIVSQIDVFRKNKKYYYQRVHLTIMKSHRGGPVLTSSQVMWDLWYSNRHWGRFAPSISVSLVNHSTYCYTLIVIRHPGLVQETY